MWQVEDSTPQKRDSSAIEELLRDIWFADYDYRVTVRTNRIEALNTFQNQLDQFYLVITDQTMPGMTGIDMARRMLQIRPGMPIILCTGYSSLISGRRLTVKTSDVLPTK